MKGKVTRAKIVGYIDADCANTSEFEDILEYIREIGHAEIVSYEILNENTPFPEIEPEN